jgi:hypothetical protein
MTLLFCRAAQTTCLKNTLPNVALLGIPARPRVNLVGETIALLKNTALSHLHFVRNHLIFEKWIVVNPLHIFTTSKLFMTKRRYQQGLGARPSLSAMILNF